MNTVFEAIGVVAMSTSSPILSTIFFIITSYYGCCASTIRSFPTLTNFMIGEKIGCSGCAATRNVAFTNRYNEAYLSALKPMEMNKYVYICHSA